MAKAGRKLGVSIFTLMQNSGISREDLAQKLGYSYRDVCRMLEGRLLLPPVEVARVAEVLGVTKGQLLHYETDGSVPELQYMKDFENPDNLDKVLDLIDEYIELRESCRE